MHIAVSRRQFLKSSAIFASAGMAPAFLTRSVSGAALPINGFKDDRVLVVIQLSGGNDGLNTVVPYSNDVYYQNRPTLGLKEDRLLKFNDDLALNDRLEGLMRLYDDGKLGVVQNVGYPNPDRSHFRSMEIWHTASDSDAFVGSGWIGRYFDNTCSGSARPQAGVAITRERPQAFDGDEGFGVVFDRPERFGWRPGKGGDTLERFAELNAEKRAGNATLDFLQRTTSNAIMSSQEVREAADRAGFESSNRGRIDHLRTVAGLIKGDLATRIYYVSMGGFDTHAGQAGQHENLLDRFSTSLAEFQETLEKEGLADRVLTMVFSEFGRRVGQNASGGTDHGTAAPMFLVGSNVRPGLHGSMPDLTDLDKGDLKYKVDFRSVYATVLEDWFRTDSTAILQQQFDTLPLIG
jgi:uncharacterized protein (DUF1501 family)